MVMTFGNVWMPCMSYRGIEHYYGHIYKVADQVVCVTGPTTGYVDGHDGDVYWSKHDVSWWYEKNPYLAKINIKSDKNFLGTWNFACHIMIVSSLLMGKDGHILHIGTKGKEGTARQENYCDCCEIDARANSNKYITFNGRIVSWYLVGNHFIVSHNTIDGGDKRPSDGTRLDHFATNSIVNNIIEKPTSTGNFNEMAADYYNLNGQKVTKPRTRKGVYIKNKRKIVSR